jgi:hypothetical protein
MTKGVLPIYRMVLKVLGFLEGIADFEGIWLSRCFGALCGAQGCIQRINALHLVSFDKCTLSLVACEIWQWVVHPGFETKGSSLQKSGVKNRKASKKGQKFSSRSTVFFIPRLFQAHVRNFCMSVAISLSWWGREARIRTEICFNVRVIVTCCHTSCFNDFIRIPLCEKHSPSIFVMRAFCWKITTWTNRKVWLSLFHIPTCSFK